MAVKQTAFKTTSDVKLSSLWATQLAIAWEFHFLDSWLSYSLTIDLHTSHKVSNLCSDSVGDTATLQSHREQKIRQNFWHFMHEQVTIQIIHV